MEGLAVMASEEGMAAVLVATGAVVAAATGAVVAVATGAAGMDAAVYMAEGLVVAWEVELVVAAREVELVAPGTASGAA